MKKLTYHQSEVFEKVVRDRSGRMFRVRFVVVERGGTLRGRIVSCELVPNLSPFSKRGEGRVRGCFLSGKAAAPMLPAAPKTFAHKVSPYFNKFAFLTAIKIRAPSKD